MADSRHIANRARDEAQAWRDIYRQPIPGKTIADRLGQYVSAYTLYSSVRPFGTSTIVGTMTEKEGPSLFMIEPSGVYWVIICNIRAITYDFADSFMIGISWLCCWQG